MNNPLNDTSNWMGFGDEPLVGFPWKKGSEGVTDGILIWSDVFLHTTENAEKLAIILVDTQGLFGAKVRKKTKTI